MVLNLRQGSSTINYFNYICQEARTFLDRHLGGSDTQIKWNKYRIFDIHFAIQSHTRFYGLVTQKWSMGHSLIMTALHSLPKCNHPMKLNFDLCCCIFVLTFFYIINLSSAPIYFLPLPTVRDSNDYSCFLVYNLCSKKTWKSDHTLLQQASRPNPTTSPAPLTRPSLITHLCIIKFRRASFICIVFFYKTLITVKFEGHRNTEHRHHQSVSAWTWAPLAEIQAGFSSTAPLLLNYWHGFNDKCLVTDANWQSREWFISGLLLWLARDSNRGQWAIIVPHSSLYFYFYSNSRLYF